MNQVVERAMFCQKTMEEIGVMMPSAAAGMASVVSLFQQVLGTALQGGATPPPAPSAPGGGMMQQPSGATPGA
jgi:hypothetical protein